MTNKTSKRLNVILALLLAAAVIVCAVFAGIYFADVPQTTVESYPEADRSGGVVTESGEVLESGNVYPLPARMAFTSVTRESALADNGVTVQATVLPQDATNREVDWSLSWASPASSWASGKTVTDYVTVTPTEDGALTATVTNLQAFGEQAVVTVTSRENPEVSATCTVDYAQRLIGASLSFGGIDTVYQGETPVTWEVATNVQGNGGKAEFKYMTDDVYTVADEYTVEYHVDNTYVQPSGSEFTGFTVSDALATDIENGENIYFDCSFFYDYVTAEIGVTISKNGWQSGFTNIFMSPIASQSDPGNYFTIDLTVTVDGTYSDYIYYTSITVGGLMNNSVITGLTLDENGIIF